MHFSGTTVLGADSMSDRLGWIRGSIWNASAILYHFSVEGKFSVYVVGDGAFDVPCKNERFEQNHIDEYIIPTNVQF